VLGRIDLVRALGRGGIRSVVVGSPHDPIRHSRLVERVIERDELLEADAPAPLFYDSDAALQFVSRERERLAARYRFVIPERELVDELLDKERFAALAERLGLPVPRSVALSARDGIGDLRFPVVVKAGPYRDRRWEEVAGSSKVLRVDDAAALRELAERVAAAGIAAIAQELVPGGEERIESYHVYVDERGEVAGEFTGRKIRTAPRDFGMTTSLETTDDRDVAALGREVVERLGLRGVAKLDFKRAPDGGLHLLEVNPRFTLWTHAGAVAGVNLPAIVHADLTDRPRPAAATARAGVRWIWPSADAAAARERAIPLRSWIPWALRVETNSSFALRDPAPYVMGRLRRTR
jgi:D-aspartate ligase